MIWVILGVFAALAVFFGILTKWAWDENHDGVSFTSVILSIVSAGVGIIVFICACGFISDVSYLDVIDDKIAMYEEENAKIEQQIETVVKQYQEYETGVFADLKGDEAITVVSLYPELKSDTLVQSQIEVYVENNQKIKELRESEINGSVARWWLYFGE